jgi:hypothetical protein
MRWLLALAIVTCVTPASADWVEGGLQLGVIDRRLGNTSFRTTMNAQLYVDVTALPKFLTVGAYWNGVPAGNVATPERLSAPNVDVTIIGLRAKGFLPIPGRLRPYATIGIGRATAEFPKNTGTVCAPTCVEHTSPQSTNHYAEVPLGIGLRVDLEGPFVFTVEGSYRLALGYRNDAYERTLHESADTGGRAWTLHVSFGLAF